MMGFHDQAVEFVFSLVLFLPAIEQALKSPFFYKILAVGFCHGKGIFPEFPGLPLFLRATQPSFLKKPHHC